MADYMDMYVEGYWAFHDGVPETGNPYREGTECSNKWVQGWNDAFDGVDL